MQFFIPSLFQYKINLRVGKREITDSFNILFSQMRSLVLFFLFRKHYLCENNYPNIPAIEKIQGQS